MLVINAQRTTNWDLFISHASEDKKEFVEPLAYALSRFGLNVWYDEFALVIGDSLSRSVDRGLANSTFGLVVLSNSFLNKRWPEYELRGLTAREFQGSKVILPIWHKISYDDLVKFSPPLADKFAIKSSGLTPLQVAVRIIKAIRPDIFSRIARRIAFYRTLNNSEHVFMAPEEIKPSGFRHAQLSQDLIGRIRMIRASLFDVFPQSMDHWVEQFRKDTHPSAEVAIWERVAAVLIECTLAYPELTPSQKQQAFELICSHWADKPDYAIRKALGALPDGATEMIIQSYASSKPLFGSPAANPPESNIEPEWDSDRPLEQLDREHFPADLPEDLIRDLMRPYKQQD